MDDRRTRVRSAARALPRPEDLLALARQRHDAAAGRLTQALRANTQAHRARLDRLHGRLSLRPVRRAIALDREKLDRLWRQGARAAALLIDRRTQRLGAESKLLASLSYKSILHRGYALVRDAEGHPVRAAAAVTPGQTLAVEFADGQISVRAGASSGRDAL